jgi:uncharacterized protein
MNRTQKNKATSYHLGLLKAKLAKLRRELLDGSKGGSSGAGAASSDAGFVSLLNCSLHEAST